MSLGSAVVDIVADTSQFDQEVADTGKALSTKLTGSAVKELGKVDKALDNTKGELSDLASEAKETGSRMDGLGDGADTAEQRVMGLRDMIDGTAAIMQGPGEAGISAYLQGWADLASGVSNLAAPALMALKDGLLQNVGTWIKSTGTVVVQAGRQIAAWALMGVQSLIHAAKVAAAWLIAMGPIALVVAAVVGLVALIILNWDKIKKAIAAAWEAIKAGVQAAWDWIRNAVKTAIDAIVNFFKNWTLLGIIITKWDAIKKAFSDAFDWIKTKAQGLIDWFKQLPGKIGSAVAGAWDGLKTAFKTAVNWIIGKWNDLEISLGGGKILGVDIPKITIRTPNIPLFQTGGIFRAPPGQRAGLAILHDRETITPAGVRPGITLATGAVQINITGSVSDAEAARAGRLAADAALRRLAEDAVAR